MTAAPLDSMVGEVPSLVAMEALFRLPDRELVQRFCTGRDSDACAALVHRHGPMVLVGDRVTLNLLRAGQRIDVPLTLR